MPTLPASIRRALRSRLNVLLLFAPLAWAARWMAPETPWPFILGALSIIPLAGLIGHATEELADHSGPTLGGFLNATFGNAAEIIIGLVALKEGHIAIVQASITGSIIGNLLLVFGGATLVGGFGPRVAAVQPDGGDNATIMLFLGVVALIMPAVFDLTLYGRLDQLPPAIYHLSLGRRSC